MIDKRSIRIRGHMTSIAIEPLFWDELIRLAEIRGLTPAILVSQVADRCPPNLSSELRNEILMARIKEVSQAKRMLKAASKLAAARPDIASQVVRKRRA